jgi:hypothetical protein
LPNSKFSIYGWTLISKISDGAEALFEHIDKNGIIRATSEPFGLLVWKEIKCINPNLAVKLENLCDEMAVKIQQEPLWNEDGTWDSNNKVTAIKTWFLLEYYDYKNTKIK